MITFIEFIEKYKTSPNINFLTMLGESFDTPAKVTYRQPHTEEDSTYIDGSFSVGSIPHTITFEILKEDNAVQIYFAQIAQNGDRLHNDLNNLSKAQTLSVFSTVIKESNELIKKYNFSVVVFEATTQKKFSLYRRIIQNNVGKNYNLVEDGKKIILFKSKGINHKDASNIIKKFKDKYTYKHK